MLKVHQTIGRSHYGLPAWLDEPRTGVVRRSCICSFSGTVQGAALIAILRIAMPSSLSPLFGRIRLGTARVIFIGCPFVPAVESPIYANPFRFDCLLTGM